MTVALVLAPPMLDRFLNEMPVLQVEGSWQRSDRLRQIECEMKPVGHLLRLRCPTTGTIGVAALAVTAHQHHLRVFFQPRGQRVSRARRQQIQHYYAALEIDKGRAE
ncbi:MAG TPA: hypothetical protein VGM98_21525 [Schlesneria sp.]